MGLSRMASKCNICLQRDRCSRKRMEGLGYIQPATTDVAEAAAAPVLKKHRYREVKVADGMTVTIDLEEVAEKIRQDFYQSQLGRFC